MSEVAGSEYSDDSGVPSDGVDEWDYDLGTG